MKFFSSWNFLYRFLKLKKRRLNFVEHGRADGLGCRGAGIYSTPFIDKDTIYFSSLDKCIYALDAAMGKEKWTFSTNGRIFASPVMMEGSLWCGSNDGRLYEIAPASGTVRHPRQRRWLDEWGRPEGDRTLAEVIEPTL